LGHPASDRPEETIPSLPYIGMQDGKRIAMRHLRRRQAVVGVNARTASRYGECALGKSALTPRCCGLQKRTRDASLRHAYEPGQMVAQAVPKVTPHLAPTRRVVVERSKVELWGQ